MQDLLGRLPASRCPGSVQFAETFGVMVVKAR